MWPSRWRLGPKYVRSYDSGSLLLSHSSFSSLWCFSFNQATTVMWETKASFLLREDEWKFLPDAEKLCPWARHWSLNCKEIIHVKHAKAQLTFLTQHFHILMKNNKSHLSVCIGFWGSFHSSKPSQHHQRQHYICLAHLHPQSLFSCHVKCGTYCLKMWTSMLSK